MTRLVPHTLIVASVSAVCTASATHAAVITVGPGVGYDYAQVWQAVAVAQPGDSIYAAARTVDGARFSYESFDLEAGAPGVELTWGNSPGVIEVGGNLRVGANATMVFELAGTDNSRALTSGRVDYDVVFVDGNFALQGNLAVTLSNSFVPSVGDAFELIATSGSIVPTGALLTHLTLPSLGGGLSWQVSIAPSSYGAAGFGGQSLFITAVPAPGAWALLGVSALMARRRR
ncbi:MAG: hypothetical protein RI990_86 [Planctomycetota bacterium]